MSEEVAVAEEHDLPLDEYHRAGDEIMGETRRGTKRSIPAATM
jgi:hypothetical protein